MTVLWPYLLEWGSMLLRWLHVTAAIAWIGGSFFFMHLDATLKKSADDKEGVAGVAWQVHGGGFYEMSKYLLAPPKLPEHLTWHKWQSYWTWMSGFSLLCWVYYGQASFFLIDPGILPLQPWQAALIGVAALALGWVVYDLICKSPLARNDALLALAGFGFVVLTSFVFTKLFSGRGALIHTGALMATMMTANVFLVITPNQRKSVARLMAGELPDPKWAKQSKLRSTHNNYITLPVLFMMLSNHYPITYANPLWIPAIVTCVIIAGALVRYFYNSWHADHGKAPWWAWVVAALAIVAAFAISVAGSLAVRSADEPTQTSAISAPKAPDAVVEIVESRCSMCHTQDPVWEGLAAAPKGVRLDSPEHIAAFAPAIRMAAVLTHAMPPNNLTEITAKERATLAQWLDVPRVRRE